MYSHRIVPLFLAVKRTPRVILLLIPANSRTVYFRPPEVIGGRLSGGLRHCFCSVDLGIWHIFQIPSVAVSQYKFLLSRYTNILGRNFDVCQYLETASNFVTWVSASLNLKGIILKICNLSKSLSLNLKGIIFKFRNLSKWLTQFERIHLRIL